MAQGKRISADIGEAALHAIKELGAAAKLARTNAGEGQAVAAARLGVHVQTIARIESGEPGVAIGHVLGMLALYGVGLHVAPIAPSIAALSQEGASDGSIRLDGEIIRGLAARRRDRAG
jgi:HTH-type transcriptional regulator / antitoxin HipB